MGNFIKITEKEADELEAQGVAELFDCSHCGGFFEATGRTDIILVIRDDGYYIRAREDLVKSNDGVFVGFCEDGKPPEFDEVFQIEIL